MANRQRMKDRARGYRKLFAQNWTMFRSSRVGVMGLAVMIAFLVVALLAPFMGLRDPIRWTAPTEDILQVDAYWEPPLSLGLQGSFFRDVRQVNTSLAIRYAPAAFGPVTDRIYMAAGTELFSLRSWKGESAWIANGSKTHVDLTRFSNGTVISTGTVSADPIVVNQGSYVGSAGRDQLIPEYFIYVGMSDGTLIVLRDSYSTEDLSSSPPYRATARARIEQTFKLDGAVTGIAVYSPDQNAGRNGRERVAATTAAGSVYLMGIEPAGNPNSPPDGISNTSATHTILGVWPLPLQRTGTAAHIASSPMIGTVPQYSPAFSAFGDRLAVGTEDGVLHMLDTGDASEKWNLTLIPPTLRWTTAPVISTASTGPPHFEQDIVYAALPGGWIVPRYVHDLRGNLRGKNATIAGWEDFPPHPGIADGASQIGPTAIQNDTGVLSQPVISGASLMTASSSGCVYNVRIVGTGEAGNGTVQWANCDPTLVGLDPIFPHGPVLVEGIQGLLLAGTLKATPEATERTAGVFYALRFDTGEQQYRIDLDEETIPGRPLAWKDPEHIREAVWFIGTNTTAATVYSYDSAGSVITPSAPSWAYTHDCVDNPGTTCPGYPSGNTYWLGLDQRGRDVFSQLIWGSRIALLVGFLSAFFSVLIGMVIGLVAGYLGGRIDTILMRFTDVILVIPGLPLIIILAAVLGASIGNIILILALLGWSGVARVIRAEVLSLKERPFIESARVSGASPTRIMFRHIAPNVMPLAFLFMTFGVSGAILSEAALSFIGLGDVNTMSWGIMLFYVQNSDALKAWWWLIPPGLAITLVSLAFFMIGRAFEEIVNPRLRKR